MKKKFRKFLIGLILLSTILAIFYLIVGPNFLYLFTQNYMFDIEEVEVMGKAYIRGTLRWDFEKNHIILFIYSLYTGIFFIIDYLIRRRENYLSEKIVLNIQERILSLVKGELNNNEPIYLEIDNIIRTLLKDKENISKLYKENIFEHNQSMAFLAHDLKTPLTSIYGYLSLLNDEPEMSENSRKKYIKIALSKANELEELIKDFFELARFNMENQILDKEKIDLYIMILQMKETFYPIIVQKSLKVEINIEKKLIIPVDPDLIARAFYNIIKNAVSYTDEGGTIKISSWVENNHCIINFENETSDLDNNIVNHIFEPFYRSEPSRNKEKEGAGLGLAIAKAIIEKHGGIIRSEYRDGILQIQTRLPL